MAAADTIKNFNLFVDGRGYAGKVEDFTPPALTLLTEDLRLGGMDSSVSLDMGMEKLTASFTLASYDRDVLALYGVAPGNEVPFSLRAAAESQDGTVTAIVHTMRGKITSIEQGQLKAGERANLSITLDMTFYALKHGEVDLIEIDVLNMKRVINGVDRLKEIRNAIGL